MRFINLFIGSLFVVGVLMSCNMPANQEESGIEVLACKEFDQKLSEVNDAQLVDVRTPQEYSGGTIGNAVNMDYYAEDFKQQISKLDKDKPLFVFCKKGGRSASSANICKGLGFKEIYDLEGGYTAWQQYKK